MSSRKAFRAVTLHLVAGLLLFAAASAEAVVKPPDSVLPDFDAAGGPTIGLPAGAVPSASQLAALSGLESYSGAPLQVVYNGISRVPRVLIGHAALSAPSREPVEAIALRFIRTNAAIWRLSDSDIAGLVPNATYTDRHNGVSHVYYTQMAHGLPVFPASFSVHTTARGEVIAVTGDAFPSVAAPAPFLISPEQAAQLAAANAGVTYIPARIATNGDAVVLAQGPLLEPVTVSRSIYASLGTSRSAYRMVLHKNSMEWYEFLVDASDGQVLYRRNQYQFLTGTVTPSAPVEPNPSVVRGLVYQEHPMATVRGTGDLFRKYPTTTDPTGMPRGTASAPLNGAETQTTSNGGIIPQTLLALPYAGAPLRSTAYPFSTSPQSAMGWFIPTGGKYLSIGNNVDAKDDHAADNEGTAGLRADGGTTGDFTGPELVYRNSYGQGTGHAADTPSAVMTLFYLNNWYHDLLYHLGFTEAAGNFQKDNFGRGGLGNDYVFADAQDGSGTDNANFGTPVDGSNPRMQMYLFTAPNRDGTLDGDVIIHEYSHGLSNRLVGGPNNVSCLGNPAGSFGLNESGGMGEGWGDWIAAMTYDEPTMGEFATGNNTVGIRRYAMNNANDLWTYQNLCTGAPTDPNPLGCQVHETGIFWSSTLWEMRESMINRFHNRAYPANKFPTFVPQDTIATGAAGNIKNAQGRTIDGSGNVAQIDRPNIENATFTALFEVVDAMKLAPCQPTIPAMRDAILLADRNLTGGEFQDVIWRTFANRGVGELARSGGSDALAKVGDFRVPANVAACEAAGGPLDAPSFTVTAGPDGTATVTITNLAGAQSYLITASLDRAGTPVDPAPFFTLGTKTPDAGATTTFNASGLSGGTTYYFRVRALRNAACVSASNVVSIAAIGNVACATDPNFAGLLDVTDPGDCQHLVLTWAPATPGCPFALTMKYNVYRGETPDFVPAAGNLIATVVGNTYVDTPGAMDKLFYYIVRAEDSTTNNGGPANGGNEDNNTNRRSGLVTSGTLKNQGFVDNVEEGPDDTHSKHFTSSGMTAPSIPQRGGWFRHANPAPVVPTSPTRVWHAYNADNPPPDNMPWRLESDAFTIEKDSILTFFHTFQIESGFDGGVVEVMINGGDWVDLGAAIYENGYTGVINQGAEENTNPLFGRRAYTGGLLGPMRRVRAFLGGFIPTGSTTAEARVRFLFATDIANNIPPSGPAGNFLPGWYIDDVTIDEPCCATEPAPLNLVARAENDAITLTWNPVPNAESYVILRAEYEGAVPTAFTRVIATVPATQTSYVDTNVLNGVDYAYVVRAILRDTGCATANSAVATVRAIVFACRVDPEFEGLVSVTAPPLATCSLDLTWAPANPLCAGVLVRYNIYRSTDPNFVPSEENRIASGVTGTTYRDQDNLVSGTTYYYIVRAEDTTTGSSGPANNGNEDDNTFRFSGTPAGAFIPGADFIDDMEPAANPGYQTFNNRATPGWTQIVDPTAHSETHSWFTPDEQPSAQPLSVPKDARLVLPVVNLTANSIFTFWHNYDFARFGPQTSADTRYHSGGVLEISTDGVSWHDLGQYITIGGYNGVIGPTAMNPLAGKRAWVGSSDGDIAPPGREDRMTQVSVDLGQAIGQLFSVTELPVVRIRLRMGGTFQVLIGGFPGTGWGVDDFRITNVLSRAACSTATDTLQFTAGNFSVNEDAGSVTITVTRTGPATQAATVNYSTSDGSATANSDYTPVSGTLTFAGERTEGGTTVPGETSKSFTIPIIDDTLVESPETILVNLSSASSGTRITQQTATVTINDNDVAGTVQFGSATFTAAEASGSVTVTVTRTGGAASGVSVNYATIDGTATAGSDYTQTSGTVTFAAGETTKSFIVAINADAVTEGDETFTVVLSAPSGGATLGTPSSATITITEGGTQPPTGPCTNDTTPPVVTAPASITIMQTACAANGSGGATGATSAELSNYLASGNGADSCTQATRLSPQVNGSDVTSETFFPAGTTTVTFRYRDAAGNIGTATSTVTVRVYGDLNVDRTVDATDAVILANFLVGNVNAGTAPFTAPATAADLNRDGNIDAVDFVIHLNHLVGNIACLPTE